MEQPIHFYNQHGEKLAGSLHLPKQHNGCGVVFGHCFTCTRHTRIIRETCDALAADNFLALRFDFSGNGQSEGEFSKSTYSKQVAEMQEASGVILKKGVRRLGLAGHSMGAVIAVLTAPRIETVKAVCTLAGRLTGLNASNFFSRSQIKELENTGKVSFTSRGRSLQLSTEFFADAKQYDLPETVKSLKTPLMVVHGDADEIIPVDNAYLAKSLNPEHMELAVIAGADHMFSNDKHRSQIVKLVVRWFKERLHESF
ncbi:MAG: alpha/beta hydrolase [Desulfobacterales bacterium]|nr:alpha/beta hydrolase [Desulfobacterales bacterium]